MIFTPETIADPRTVDVHYEAQRLRDTAAHGFGVSRDREGPTGELAEEAYRLENDLGLFMREAWHVLEPATPFVPNWHIDAIAEHLEAVTEREIKKLVINIPPRMLKSLAVSVFWFCWEWTTKPWTKWLYSSYIEKLSVRDSLKCRNLIRSAWYQARWGHLFALSGDQNVKTRFDNTRSGFRIATSETGFATGEGGDTLVWDDPHNPKKAESAQTRDATLEWHDQTWSTRLNDPVNGAKVGIMQRLHEQDMTGHILATEDGWEHLMLPMRYDPKRSSVTVIGNNDPRTEEGELLFAERFPEEAVRAIEKSLGPYGRAGQFQQSPTARKGGQFERAWFSLEQDIQRGSTLIRVRFWDKAGTEGAGAYTAGVLIAIRVTDGRVWVEDVVRGQWGAANRERIIRETAELDAMRYGTPKPGNGQIIPNKHEVLYLIEQEPGSGGKDSAKATVRNLAGYRARAETASGDKFIRADPFAGAAENGDVTVLIRDWTDAYLAEMEAAGPGAAYLDQMDGSSGAYNEAIEVYDERRLSSMQGVRMEELEDTSLDRDRIWEIA